MTIKRFAGICALAVLVFGGIAVTSAFVHRVNAAKAPKSKRGHFHLSYSPGRKLLFIYVGSEDCGFSLVPGFDETVKQAKRAVETHARAKRVAYSSLGISAGPSVEDGIKYLTRFGAFDEVAVGHGQLNTAIMRYVWEEFPGDPSFPQILIVDRSLVDRDPGFTFDDERVLVRIVGVPAIEHWVAANAPIE